MITTMRIFNVLMQHCTIRNMYAHECIVIILCQYFIVLHCITLKYYCICTDSLGGGGGYGLLHCF